MKTSLALTATLLTLGAVAPTAHAGFTVYTTRTSWQAAVGSFNTETFDSIATQAIPTAGGIVTTPNFTITVDANHGGQGIFDNGPVNGTRGFLGDAHGTGTPAFDRFDFNRSLNAFGSDFANIDEGGLLDVRILTSSFQIPNGSTFFGVVSTDPFRSVDFRTTGSTAEYYNMDNVSFGPVPEPTTLAALGLGAVAMLRRRKRT